jgi:hypothetical protein
MKTLTNNVLGKITIAGAALGLLLGAQFSLAAKPTDYPPLMCIGITNAACSTEFSVLCGDIESAGAPLKQRTKNGLMTKLFDADGKMNQDKVAHVLVKLDDIDYTIHALDDAAKPKIGEGDFAVIHTSLEAAQYCVTLQLD